MMVNRYDPWFDEWDGVVVMDVEDGGDWVSYDDYKAQATRIEQLEAALERVRRIASTVDAAPLSMAEIVARIDMEIPRLAKDTQ